MDAISEWQENALSSIEALARGWGVSIEMQSWREGQEPSVIIWMTEQQGPDCEAEMISLLTVAMRKIRNWLNPNHKSRCEVLNI